MRALLDDGKRATDVTADFHVTGGGVEIGVLLHADVQRDGLQVDAVVDNIERQVHTIPAEHKWPGGGGETNAVKRGTRGDVVVGVGLDCAGEDQRYVLRGSHTTP